MAVGRECGIDAEIARKEQRAATDATCALAVGLALIGSVWRLGAFFAFCP